MIDPGAASTRPELERPPGTRALLLLLVVVIVAGVFLAAAATMVTSLLAGRIAPDLAIVPRARGPEAIALLAGGVATLASAGAVILGRRWLRATRAAFARYEHPSPAGPASASDRPALAPLSALVREVTQGPDAAWYDHDVPSSATTAVVAMATAAAGLSLVVGGLLAGQLAPGLISARLAWHATTIGAMSLTVGATLATWLIHDIERRGRALRRVTDGTGAQTGMAERRRRRVALAIAAIALGIMGGSSAATVVIAADEEPCLSTVLECRSLTVPADQRLGDPRGAARTIGYGVRRATGERIGTLVIATGGPGVAGVPTWEFDYELLDPRLLTHYDIVAFDPRGTGGSGGLDCPTAWERYARSLSMRSEPAVISTFTEACVAEAGVAAADLGLYAGAHVAEDIEAIREDLGVDRIVLYGESYGTATATRYAMAHPDRLDALILDAPLDAAQDLEDFWAESAGGFEATLQRTFDWCQADLDCRTELPDPETAWAWLFDRLAIGPLEARYAGSDGVVRDWSITSTEAIDAFASALYTERGRMLAMRTLAAADRNDLVPLARMVHLAEEDTDAVVVDSAFTYIASLCADRVERDPPRDPAAFLAWASTVHTGTDRMRDVVLTAAACSAWPAPTIDPPPPMLPGTMTAPVVILTSTADPVTPASIGRRLADRWATAADVSRIETAGGSHVTFARGDPCTDGPITALLVDGVRPPPSTRCAGHVATTYERVVRRSADADGLLLRAFALDDELYNHPRYAAWYRVGSVTIGCRHGGTITVTFAGLTEQIAIDDCAVLPNEPTNGTGQYYRDGSFRYDARTDRGRWRYEVDGSGHRVEGTFDGVEVEESW